MPKCARFSPTGSNRVERFKLTFLSSCLKAQNSAPNPEEVDHSDVIIFSHGHFSRVFIARWCDFPLRAGYHFAADAGGVSATHSS